MKPPRSVWVFLVVLAVAFLAFGLFGYVLDLEEIERAEIPTTPIDELTPGTHAKIFGTIDAPDQVVIDLRGSGDDRYWVPIPFNLTDGTGSVHVEVGPLVHSSSFRVIRRGSHDGDWWSGDTASVIGEVKWTDDTVYIVGEYVARTPRDFYRIDIGTIGFSLVGLASLVLANPFYASRNYRIKLHQDKADDYELKVGPGRPCSNCGELLDSGIGGCPECGSVTRMPSKELGSLPTLELRTSFANLPTTERAFALGLGVIIPALLVALSIWLAFLSGVSGGVCLLAVSIAGLPFAIVVIPRFMFTQKIALGPERVESRKGFSRDAIETEEIDRLMTIRKGGKTAHSLVTRGDLAVVFGPGLSEADLEGAGQWIGELSEALGIIYHSDISLEDAEPILRRWE